MNRTALDGLIGALSLTFQVCKIAEVPVFGVSRIYVERRDNDTLATAHIRHIQKQRRHIVVRRPVRLKVRLQEIGLVNAFEGAVRGVFEGIFQEAGAIEEWKGNQREELGEIGK